MQKRPAISLSLRIALYASLCAAVSITAVCAAVSWRARQSSEAASLELARQSAETIAGGITSDLRSTLAALHALSDSLTAQKKAGQVPDRAQLDLALRSNLERYPDWIGFYSVWEPNALDGDDARNAGRGPQNDATGRFGSWWNRAQGAIAVTPVVFSPEAGANDWYDLPCRTRRDQWLDVAPFEVYGRKVLATTVAAPIVVNGKCLGMVGVDIELTQLQKRLQAIALPMSGRIALLSQRGTYVSSPDADLLGKDAADLPADVRAHVSAGEPWRFEAGGFTHLFVPVQVAGDLPSWSLELTIPTAEAQRDATALTRWASVVGAACLLASVLVMFFLVTRTMAPLRNLAAALEGLSAGSSRLDVQLASPHRDELGRIASAFNAFVHRLHDAFSGVRVVSQQVDTAAVEISSGNNDLSTRTERQVLKVHEVSQSMGALVSSIQASAEEATEVSVASDQARAEASNSLVAMKEARIAMDGLVDTSKNIESIVGVIDEIATKTNILALNAGIEAVRAGEFGKGFAVVAKEIRSLAQDSAASANEIRGLVGEAIGRIDHGRSRIQSVDQSIRHLATGVDRVNTAIATISSRLLLQTEEVQRANTAMAQFDGMAQQNAALVEEAAAASAALRSQTEKLHATVGEYIGA